MYHKTNEEIVTRFYGTVSVEYLKGVARVTFASGAVLSYRRVHRWAVTPSEIHSKAEAFQIARL